MGVRLPLFLTCWLLYTEEVRATVGRKGNEKFDNGFLSFEFNKPLINPKTLQIARFLGFILFV